MSGRPALDTVIGLAGASVLVLVMVGVFFVEYNSIEEDDDSVPDDRVMSAGDEHTFAPGGDTWTFMFTPSEGVMSFDLQVSWSPAAPATATPFASFDYSLADSGGTVLWSGSSSSPSITFHHGQPDADAYTLTVITAASNLGGSMTASAGFDY